MESADPLIQANLAQSSAFYEKWGDLSKISFDDWWKTHSFLFHTRQSFEVLSGEISADSNSLYLKISFSLAPTSASKVFTRIYREEQSKRGVGKVKRDYHGDYELTPAEFQAVNFRYYTLFAEKVYCPLLKKTGMKPVTKDMVLLAKEKFKNVIAKTSVKSKQVSKQRIAPFRQDINEDYETLARTASRYRLIVENLIRNVSLGVFPGEYQELGLKNLYVKRQKVSKDLVKKSSGRKRIARPIGYVPRKKVIDPNNPNNRKLYIK